jgi:hypothetical protein
MDEPIRWINPEYDDAVRKLRDAEQPVRGFLIPQADSETDSE